MTCGSQGGAKIGKETDINNLQAQVTKSKRLIYGGTDVCPERRRDSGAAVLDTASRILLVLGRNNLQAVGLFVP